MSSDYRFIEDSIFVVRVNQQTGAYSVVPDDKVPDITDLTLSSPPRYGYPMTYKSRRVLPFHKPFRKIYDSVNDKFVEEAPDNSKNRLQIIDTRTNSIASNVLINSGDAIGTVVKSYRLISKGLLAVTSLEPGLYDESGTKVFGPTRSYGLVVLDRVTQEVTFSKSYDVFGDVTKAKELADKLNSLDNTSIVIIITYDEPQTNRTVELLSAMYRCGASYNIFGSADFMYRSAYVLVGVPDQGAGTGIEYYTGSTVGDEDALIDTRVTINKGTPFLYNVAASTAERIYTTDYWNKCIYILDQNGVLQRKISLSSAPYDLVIGKLEIDNGEQDWLIVSLPTENRVLVLDPLNNYGIHREISTKSYPMGLALYNMYLYVVCYQDHYVQKFRVGADTMTSEDYDTDYGGVNVAITAKGTAFIPLYDSNAVYVIPQTGVTRLIRTGRGPLGVTVDPQGYVLITNSTDNTFTKVTSDDYYVIGRYNTGNYPAEIVCDNSGQTFILCKDDDELQVFRSVSGVYISSIKIQRVGYGLNKSATQNRIYLSSYASNYQERTINPHNRIRNFRAKLDLQGITGPYLPTVIRSNNVDVPRGAFANDLWMVTAKQTQFGNAEYCSAGEVLTLAVDAATPSGTSPDLVLQVLFTSDNGVVTATEVARLQKSEIWTTLTGSVTVPEGVKFAQFSITLDYATSNQRDFANRWYVTNVVHKLPNSTRMRLATISSDTLPVDNTRWNPEVDYGERVVKTTQVIKASEYDIYVSDGRRNKVARLSTSQLVIVKPRNQISLTELVANTFANHETLEYSLVLGKFNEVFVIQQQSDLYITSVDGLPRGIQLSKDKKVLYGVLHEPGKFEVTALLNNNRTLRILLKSVLYRTSAKVRYDQLSDE